MSDKPLHQTTTYRVWAVTNAHHYDSQSVGYFVGDYPSREEAEAASHTMPFTRIEEWQWVNMPRATFVGAMTQAAEECSSPCRSRMRKS